MVDEAANVQSRGERVSCKTQLDESETSDVCVCGERRSVCGERRSMYPLGRYSGVSELYKLGNNAR
jgi:hypothetical protein